MFCFWANCVQGKSRSVPPALAEADDFDIVVDLLVNLAHPVRWEASAL